MTVAHAAAKHGRLPAGFDRWNLCDRNGWTAAHVAAEHGHLPPDFLLWDLADADGVTVRQALMRNKS
jgi:ankyrin repeat protein